MEQQSHQRSSLILMELMISILFFSAASAVCILLFAKAHTLNEKSTNLDHAVRAASSAAEIVQNQEDPLPYLSALYPDGTCGEEEIEIFYAKDWSPSSSSDAVFRMQLKLHAQGHRMSGEITILQQDTILYSLPVIKALIQEAAP